jgi:tripartite-type tricarboxylate transporter receptor subunit TctC
MHRLAPFSVAVVAVWSGLQSEANAQDYPARPVTVVAPYAAGGGADLVARVLAQKLGAIAWANHSWSRTGWARAES